MSVDSGLLVHRNYSGVQRGCGWCEGPLNPAWGIQRPSFVKKNIWYMTKTGRQIFLGDELKCFEKLRNLSENVDFLPDNFFREFCSVPGIQNLYTPLRN